MEKILEQIGPYRVDGELGRGGMGVVFLGHDTRLERPVAIKALPQEFAADPERLARFERRPGAVDHGQAEEEERQDGGSRLLVRMVQQEVGEPPLGASQIAEAHHRRQVGDGAGGGRGRGEGHRQVKNTHHTVP